MESAYFVTPLDSFKCLIFNGAEPKYGVDASFIFTGIDNINGVGIPSQKKKKKMELEFSAALWFIIL